jgi:Rrf2 family protein
MHIDQPYRQYRRWTWRTHCVFYAVVIFRNKILSFAGRETWERALLTNKGKYGLKALVHLAGLKPMEIAQVSDIAEANCIPKKFLDQIFAELRKAGLVHSKKGKAGGYALARPAHSISVAQVIRILDGPIAPIPCTSLTAYRRCEDCSDEAHCPVRRIMLEARKALSSVLDNCSLAEMRMLFEASERAIAYHI